MVVGIRLCLCRSRVKSVMTAEEARMTLVLRLEVLRRVAWVEGWHDCA